MKRIVLILLGSLPFFHVARGQDSLLFTYRDFYQEILANHPIVKQSNLINESAQRELLIARGGFDPRLEGSFDRKVYDSKTYFNRGDVYLKVPIWVAGADIKVGYDRNVGETLSNDIRTGPEGISYLGLTIPIGQGMLIDYRRATLRQAEVFQKIADTERVKLVNKVVLTAAKDYWNWYFAFKQFRLAAEFYDLANVRYDAITQRSNLGEAAAIDTVEALVTLQDRQVQVDQATLELRNARLLLSNHLWGADQLPLELPDGAIPQPAVGRIVEANELVILRDMARIRHPEIIKYTFKQQQLKIDERLGREMLKPMVNLSASALYKGVTFNGSETNTGIRNAQDNYKFMVELYFPIFLRKERGKLQQIRIKQVQTNLEQQQVQREITTEINTAFNDVKTLEGQIRLQNRAVENQQILLRAEIQKFGFGESSLFLVNSRESKLNELKVKVELLRMKYEKGLATLLFASGISNWENL
jgi:outer membrane protein TolC